MNKYAVFINTANFERGSWDGDVGDISTAIGRTAVTSCADVNGARRMTPLVIR